MQGHKLRDLLAKAKTGDEEAIIQIVYCFRPVIGKYSRRLEYEGAFSDLVVWLVWAIRRYEPVSDEMRFP